MQKAAGILVGTLVLVGLGACGDEGGTGETGGDDATGGALATGGGGAATGGGSPNGGGGSAQGGGSEGGTAVPGPCDVVVAGHVAPRPVVQLAQGRVAHGFAFGPEGEVFVVDGAGGGVAELTHRDATDAVLESIDVPGWGELHIAPDGAFVIDEDDNSGGGAQVVSFDGLGPATRPTERMFHTGGALRFSVQASKAWDLYSATQDGFQVDPDFTGMPYPLVGGSQGRLVDQRGGIYDGAGHELVAPGTDATVFAAPCASCRAIFHRQEGFPGDQGASQSIYRIEMDDSVTELYSIVNAARIQLVHRFAGGDLLLWSLDNFSAIETLQRVTEEGDVVWSFDENDQSKLTPLPFEENGQSPEVFPLIREDRSKVVYYVAATGEACPPGAADQ